MNSLKAIELVNICKKFSHVIALRNITLKMEKGGIFALLGPNGAGKTTLLRVLCGIVRPSKGMALVLGKNPNDPFLRGKIGYLPQTTAGYHNLSAWENIKIFAQLAGIEYTRFQERANSLFKELRLEEKIDTNFDQLSSGEQRAVSLIRAVIIGNEILLLDEPTTGLDLERARIVRNLISRLHGEGRTIILSSHIVTDIEELAERIAVLKKGTILFYGRKEQLIQEYAPEQNLEQALLEAFDRQLNPQPVLC